MLTLPFIEFLIHKIDETRNRNKMWQYIQISNISLFMSVTELNTHTKTFSLEVGGVRNTQCELLFTHRNVINRMSEIRVNKV